MKWNIRYLCVLLGALATQSACSDVPKQYSAEAIEARVVDAETKKPLEGVVVTANWQLEEGTLGGNRSAGQLMVMETVTDKNGRFTFPAWGPKWLWKGFLVNADPKLLLFKSGYEYRELYNEYSSAPELRTRKLRYSDWNGKTIELKRFKGTMEEYVRHLSFLMTGLSFIEDDCQWKKTPKMLMALQKQADAFKASGIVTAIYSVDYMPTNEKKCGSVKEYFRRHQQ